MYGENTIGVGSQLYVCSGYPDCQAYVGVHEGTQKPKGILADSELCNKRIRAHRAIDAIRQPVIMAALIGAAGFTWKMWNV